MERHQVVLIIINSRLIRRTVETETINLRQIVETLLLLM